MAIEKDIAVKCANGIFCGVKGVAQLMDYIKDDHHEKDKVTIRNLLDYTENDDKTMLDLKNMVKTVLISSIRAGNECRELDEYDFIEDKERYREYKKGDRRGYGSIDKGQASERDAYHVIQSFPGKEHGVELDPRIAHQMGVEYAKRAFPGHKVVVTTHLNTDHIHNHIAVCAYNEDGRHKLNFDKDFRRSIRRINDEISIKYGLPILEEHKIYRPENTEHDEQRIRTKHGHTMKDIVRADIDSVLATHGSEFKSFDDFVRYLEQNLDYEITQTEKKVTFTKKKLFMKNGKPFKVKDGTLGDEYTRRHICEKYGYPKWMSIRKNGEIVREQEEFSSEREERINRFLKALRDEKDDHIVFNTEIRGDHRPFTIKIPHYTENGRKRSKLEIIILTVIEVFKYIRDRLFHCNNGMESPKTREINSMIKDYENALEIVRKYNIGTALELNNVKADLTRTHSELQAEKDFHDKKIEHDMTTVRIIREFKDLSDKLHKSGISLNDDMLFVYRPKKEEMALCDRYNNGITKRQMQKLYQLLNEDGQKYRIKCRFTELSYREADSIIRFLTGNSTHKPDMIADQTEQAAERARRLCKKRFDNIEAYKEDHFNMPISKALADKLDGYLKEDGLAIDPYRLTQGQGLGLLQYYKEIPLTDDRTITKAQAEAINRRLARKGLQLNKPTEYVLKSEYDQLRSYLDTGKGKTPDALKEFTSMSVCTKERIKTALSVSGRELVIPMEYISENAAKILESDLLYKVFTPAALEKVVKEKEILSPEQIEKINKEREPAFYESISHYPKEIQDELIAARKCVTALYDRGEDSNSEERILGEITHGRLISEGLRKEILETEVGILEVDSLGSIVDKAMQIMKEPDRYIEAYFGRDLEAQPERMTERTAGMNSYYAENEEIDDEPEEGSRKQSVWDMYYGLGH